jgi:hypothetical protein
LGLVTYDEIKRRLELTGGIPGINGSKVRCIRFGGFCRYCHMEMCLLWDEEGDQFGYCNECGGVYDRIDVGPGGRFVLGLDVVKL